MFVIFFYFYYLYFVIFFVLFGRGRGWGVGVGLEKERKEDFVKCIKSLYGCFFEELFREMVVIVFNFLYCYYMFNLMFLLFFGFK